MFSCQVFLGSIGHHFAIEYEYCVPSIPPCLKKPDRREKQLTQQMDDSSMVSHFVLKAWIQGKANDRHKTKPTTLYFSILLDIFTLSSTPRWRGHQQSQAQPRSRPRPSA
jgi:hypothetical protein